MRNAVAFLFAMTAGLMQSTASAENLVDLVLYPENPVMGQQIATLFDCQPDAANIDDVDRSRTRVRFEASYLRIDYFRFRDGPLTSEICSTTAHIGSLPMGSYPLKVYMHFVDDVDPQGVLVHERTIVVSDFVSRPGDQRPLQDFSGVYWDSTRSGESITVAQSYATNQVGMLFNGFDADSKATWHYFVSDRWLTPSQAEGRVYRVQGSKFLDTTNAPWPPVNVIEVGSGKVYFGGVTGSGVFDLTIDGIHINRSFQAFRY